MPDIPVLVRRHDHRYSIHVGGLPGPCLPEAAEKGVPAGRYVAVIDTNAHRRHELGVLFDNRPGWLTITHDAGEENKTIGSYVALCERLLAMGIDRKTVLVAVGGGVIGDLVGFAAATLLRGLRWIQIPTTLLAQVDSSVGGKTGVNMAGGKNLVGAFHQPDLVLADPAFLLSLDRRDYLSGLAEVIKYGVLADRDFFEQLVNRAGAIAGRDMNELVRVVERCCRIKADIVGGDEKESEQRQILNLGHTFGHSLEALAGYDGSVTHGEAVAIGTMMAAEFAAAKGDMPGSEVGMLKNGYRKLGLPIRLDEIGATDWRAAFASENLAEALGKDKKAQRAGLTLILPSAIGACRIAVGTPAAEVADFMRAYASGSYS